VLSDRDKENDMANKNSNMGIIAHDMQTLNGILAAMQLDGTHAEPVKVPQGKLGGCVACQQAIAAHFQAGRWIGCPEGEESTVFLLVPASMLVKGKALESKHTTVKADAATVNETATAVEESEQTRGFKRARYFSTLRANASIDTLPLSDTRKKVLRIIHKTGKQGIRAKAIMSRGKLPHGTVQQTLNWLRTQAKPLVEAREDSAAA
jgi:hypothetical protein